MKISFCTTCMGRLEHLQQTLPQNLSNNPDTADVQVEFVVLNYGDKDGMHEWMMTDTQIQEEIKAGRVVYAKTDQPFFRMAHAKNMAHRLASGDVVCNVDADNFTGKGFAEALAGHFSSAPNTVINPAYSVLRKIENTDAHGVFGRIALTRQNFERLGGYDEKYSGWGSEDCNLTRRARLLGMQYGRFEQDTFLQGIPHSDEYRVENMFSTEQERSKEVKKIDVYKRSTGFRKIWKASVDRLPMFFKSLSANGGTHFGLGDVSIFKENDVPHTFSVQPLRGTKVSLFDEVARVGHIRNLVSDRLEPEIISLKGPGAQL